MEAKDPGPIYEEEPKSRLGNIIIPVAPFGAFGRAGRRPGCIPGLLGLRLGAGIACLSRHICLHASVLFAGMPKYDNGGRFDLKAKYTDEARCQTNRHPTCRASLAISVWWCLALVSPGCGPWPAAMHRGMRTRMRM